MITILKKVCKPVIALSVILLFAYSTVQAQTNIDYTQYMDNMTPLNPAYSTLDKAGSVNSIVRKQFEGIDGSPTTVLFNLNLPIESIDGAAGVIIKNDAIGNENQTEINAFFAKSLQLSEQTFLSVSLNAGVRHYTLNNSGLIQDNDSQFMDDVRETRPNLGFGVMYYSSKYYIGISVPELTIKALGSASVNSGASNFKNTYYFTAAYLADVDEDIQFKPATLVAYAKNEPLRTNVSATVYLRQLLGIGLNYEHSNDIKQLSGIVSFNFSSFRLGYSYSFGSTSNNGVLNSGVHEVTLNYRFGKTSGSPKIL